MSCRRKKSQKEETTGEGEVRPDSNGGGGWRRTTMAVWQWIRVVGRNARGATDDSCSRDLGCRSRCSAVWLSNDGGRLTAVMAVEGAVDG